MCFCIWFPWSVALYFYIWLCTAFLICVFRAKKCKTLPEKMCKHICSYYFKMLIKTLAHGFFQWPQKGAKAIYYPENYLNLQQCSRWSFVHCWHTSQTDSWGNFTQEALQISKVHCYLEELNGNYLFGKTITFSLFQVLHGVNMDRLGMADYTMNRSLVDHRANTEWHSVLQTIYCRHLA